MTIQNVTGSLANPASVRTSVRMYHLDIPEAMHTSVSSPVGKKPACQSTLATPSLAERSSMACTALCLALRRAEMPFEAYIVM